MVRSYSLFVSAIAVSFWLPTTHAQDKKEDKKEDPAAIIVGLKEGAKVEQSEDVNGELKSDGYPVIFVKPLEGGNQPWWIQAPIEEVTDKKFSGQVQFGADDSKPGTKFRVVIVVAKDKAEALKFERGKTRAALPPGLPKSDPITVVRK